MRVVVGSCICIAGSIFLCPLIVIGSLNQQLPHYYDRTNNINGMEPLAQGSTDPDGYGGEGMSDEAVLDKMKQSIKISDDELKDLMDVCFDVKEFPLNDKGMYEGFNQDIGYSSKWFAPESTYWWVEDLVIDTLKKEKVFGDVQILLTRNLVAKERCSLGAVFKGPLSTIDLWMPGYGFAEVKYAGNCERDQWGYDLSNSAILNIHSVPGLSDIMKHDMWKDSKLFLIIVHEPDPGDKVSISIIDLYDKFDLSPWSKEKTSKPRLHPNLRQVCVNVRSENCLARFDNVPYRAYRKRGHEEKY